MNRSSLPKPPLAPRRGGSALGALLALLAVLGGAPARAAEAPGPAASAPAMAPGEVLPAPPAPAASAASSASAAPESRPLPATPSSAPPSAAPAARVALTPSRRSRPAAPGGPTWSSLSAAQRSALHPLQHEWAGIDAARKQKWIEIAQRFPRLTPDEQARLHARMRQWVRMSPEQRNSARLTFQEAQQLPPQVRQDRWAEYLALPEPERQRLAEQAQRLPDRPSRPAGRGTIAGSSFAKTNIVPQPPHAAPLRPVTPAVLRAGLGATTLPLRHVPQPPAHLKPGLPKIMATPELVDPRTLAPRVGPQAAGVSARKPERRP